MIYFSLRVPERHIFLQIAGTLQHRLGDDPMNVHPPVRDVLKNAFVSSRLAPHIVVLRQTIYGDGDSEKGDIHPFLRNRNHRAGNDHGEHAHSVQGGKNAAQLTMPH